MSESKPPPNPPVPKNCDLRAFPHIFLPIDLISSDPWFLTATDAAFAAMIRLMVASWRQLPASSLANNRPILAKLGQITGKKARVLDEVLPQWVICSDGRLYHPQISKIALEAWVKRTAQMKKTEAARAEKERRRDSVTDSVTENVTAVQRRGEERKVQNWKGWDEREDEKPF